jgi:Reverse transcriptase (RNA-dependent DNA polymerase)
MKLGKQLLHHGLSAVLAHGYGSFFPQPPELPIVKKHWKALKLYLSDLDLDIYTGYGQIWSFAPKSRLNVRKVGLLHPFDLILYTSLVLVLREKIASSRLAPSIVFSYRTENAPKGRLYGDTPSWKDFREAAVSRISAGGPAFVGITDIADFYPRIYQHRLVNALEVITEPAQKEYVRVLEKMLARFSENTSYGIPVGPAASRLLAEAELVDVDSTLLSYGIEFIRYVDDFVIFATTAKDAEFGIRILGETLFQNHGLTLQTAKTKVLSVEDYLERHLTIHSEKEKQRRELLGILEEDPYGTSYKDLDEDLKKEIDAFNLSEMLEEALAEAENVDYREVSFILGRLSALQKPELIPIVLSNLERLYPVAEAVAAFFNKFTMLSKSTRREIADSVLSPILNKDEARPSDYYSIWMLSIFGNDSAWNHEQSLVRIFREASSDAVRRFAALALATSGSRSQAVALKEHLSEGSPLCRTAMLLATAKLGVDERKHLKSSLSLKDPLEKLCISEKI